MSNLKVALVQANQLWEDKNANFSNYSRLLENVHCELILLPEMFQTGFSMNTTELAETMTGESVQWLKELSHEKGAAVYTSLIVKENELYHNRGVFITPKGSVNVYDKRKSFGLAGEDNYYTSGEKESIVEYKGWKMQLQICYDLRFPEIVRNRILPNQQPAYDVILYVANWPEKRREHWNALLKARAIENQCFVVGVNRVGMDAKEFSYTGDSKVVDALGNEFNVVSGIESVETFVMKQDDLTKIRELLPFLKDA